MAAEISLDFRGKGSIAVHSAGPSWDARQPGPARRALGGASITTGVVRILEEQTAMANKQTRKPTENAGRSNAGEVTKAAHKSARQPRRRNSRSGSVAAQSHPTAVSAAIPVPTAAGNDVVPPTRDEPAQPADGTPSQSRGADAVTTSACGVDRSPASTKRAKLIGMLDRAEGASVAELGQRLGWLPHTVRAAITGLRHAGREVTRSKDENGKSIYRLAPVEARDR